MSSTNSADLPLHLLLGGALRDRVAVAVPLPLDQALAGRPIPSTVVSTERSVPVIVQQLERLRMPGIGLHLSGQFMASELGPLLQAAPRLALRYIADPCADVAAGCAAFAGARVPLALTAHRYEQAALTAAACAGGLQVLLIDPSETGGIEAARPLATLAELCGMEVGLDARTGDQLEMAASLASTLDACTRPLLLSAENATRLAADGSVRIAAGEQHLPRIVRVTLRRVSVRMRQLYVSAMYMRRTTERTIVEVETDDGQRGFGETNGTADVWSGCAEMARKLVGRSPLDHLPLRRSCVGSVVASRNGLRDWSAWAGLEMALLDWRGRHLGQPLHRLLGNAGAGSHAAVCHIPALLLEQPIDRRDLPRLFADPGQRRAVVEHTRHHRQQHGFRAFKIKSTGTDPDWDVALLRDLRAALGPGVSLRWDPNANYPPAEAAALVQRLEELKLEFYEDPTRGIAGMAQVRGHVSTPLATNMCVISFDHLAHAIRQPCVDVLLADVVMWGGPQSIVDLAGVAPLLGLDLTIHSAFELGIGTAMNLHLAAALAPIRRPVDFGLENMEQELITLRIPVRDGHVRAPDGPGLGVMPDWDQVARCQTEAVTIQA